MTYIALRRPEHVYSAEQLPVARVSVLYERCIMSEWWANTTHHTLLGN